MNDAYIRTSVEVRAASDGSAVVVGPVVRYPGSDDRWSVAIATASAKTCECQLTRADLGNVRSEPPAALIAGFATIIEIRGPNDLSEEEASEGRRNFIRVLDERFPEIWVSENDLEFAQKAEQLWPGPMIEAIRAQIEAELSHAKKSEQR